MQENVTLKFRPHHFLCAIGFQGKGYSDEFVENFKEIVDQLRGPNGDNIKIEVTQFTDSICSPCPHKRNTLCATQEKIQHLDEAHAQILGIKAGDILSWGEAKQRIIERMHLAAFDNACSTCNWKKMGVCEQALRDLLNVNKV